mgnify:CR=1 FL=1
MRQARPARLTGQHLETLFSRLSAALVLAAICAARALAAEPGWPEKEELTFGFIKLTDMAPIAIAYEKGYFEDEGLYVTLEPQANWKVLLDRVITGELDGAHMLAGQPLAATIGFGTKAHIITPFSMDLNGNGITVSNEVWEMMKPNIPTMDDGRPVHPIKADYLKPVIEQADFILLAGYDPIEMRTGWRNLWDPERQTVVELLAAPEYSYMHSASMTFHAHVGESLKVLGDSVDPRETWPGSLIADTRSALAGAFGQNEAWGPAAITTSQPIAM